MLSEEDEKKQFDSAIAGAIAAWSSVEMNLCMFFSMALTVREVDPRAVTIFYAIENFRSKLQVVDAVMSLVFRHESYEEQLKRWQTLHKHLGKRSTKRNKIVHHERIEHLANEPGKRYGLIGNFLVPATQRNLETGAQKPMYLHELNEAKAEFSNMAKQLRMFTEEIKPMAALGFPPKRPPGFP